MQVRKLVKAGQASHTVSLPKAWLQKNNLKAGDTLYIKEKSDKELIVTAELKEASLPQKEIIISIEGKELDTIQRELSSAYVNNYRSIHFSGEGVEQKLPAIRTLLQGFVALEITEQSPKSIVVKDLLDLNEISLDKTLKRMDMMVRTMLAECGEPERNEQLHVKDEEVNKLYFLLVRLLNSALTTQGMAERFSLSHKQILSQWYLVVNLENLADYAKNANNAAQNLGKEKTKAARELLHAIQQDFETIMKAWYQKDKAAADAVARNRLTLVEHATNFVAKHRESLIVEFAEQCKAMTTVITNIARIVLDTE